jgi:hypothetical protein
LEQTFANVGSRAPSKVCCFQAFALITHGQERPFGHVASMQTFAVKPPFKEEPWLENTDS